MINKIEIGKYIQKLRGEAKITQKELATTMHLSYQSVSKWETGETLPNAMLLPKLAEILNTSIDKILSGGKIITKNTKYIKIINIVEGLEAIKKLKYQLGDFFYEIIISGLKNKLNIDFDMYMKDKFDREILITEVIINYILNGYSVKKDEVDEYVKSNKMRKIIYRYIGEEVTMNKIYYQDNQKLFEQIRSLKPELKEVSELVSLPGEFLKLTKGKDYYACEVSAGRDLCYGLAVDDEDIYLFSYGTNGINQTLIVKEKIVK